MAETKPVQSLLRGIDLLQILAENDGGMRLQDLSDRVRLKVPTTHNLLRTLALRGLVEKQDGCMYVIGPAMVQMAGKLFDTRLVRLAENAVLELGAKPYRPFVNFCQVTGMQIQLRLRISPDSPNVVQRPVGRNNSLYSTATGIAALAFSPEDLVLSLKETNPFEEYGLGFWKSREALAAAVEDTRRKGVAVFPWEGSELFKAATIIRGHGDTTILGLAVPTTRAKDEKIRDAAVKDLLVAAEALSAALASA